MKALVLALFLCLIPVTVCAAERPLDWNKEEVSKYAVMSLNAFLIDKAPFTGPQEAGMLITCHMASAMQILRNEGIIYRYEVILQHKADSDEIRFEIKVMMDVGDKPFVLKFNLDREKPTSKAPDSKKA